MEIYVDSLRKTLHIKEHKGEYLILRIGRLGRGNLEIFRKLCFKNCRDSLEVEKGEFYRQIDFLVKICYINSPTPASNLFFYFF